MTSASAALSWTSTTPPPAPPPSAAWLFSKAISPLWPHPPLPWRPEDSKRSLFRLLTLESRLQAESDDRLKAGLQRSTPRVVIPPPFRYIASQSQAASWIAGSPMAKAKKSKGSLPKLIERYYADLAEFASQNVLFEMGTR